MAGRSKTLNRGKNSANKTRRKLPTSQSKSENRRKPQRKTLSHRIDSSDPRVFAGFHRKANKLATLEEVRDPDVPTRTIGELSFKELVKLVSSRIEGDENFIALHMLGVDGVVDKARALKEVRAGSHIGLHLIEIEKEYLSLQLRRKE
jgi:hypothetical protein